MTTILQAQPPITIIKVKEFFLDNGEGLQPDLPCYFGFSYYPRGAEEKVFYLTASVF
jgi:hypothetical protein